MKNMKLKAKYIESEKKLKIYLCCRDLSLVVYSEHLWRLANILDSRYGYAHFVICGDSLDFSTLNLSIDDSIEVEMKNGIIWSLSRLIYEQNKADDEGRKLDYD